MPVVALAKRVLNLAGEFVRQRSGRCPSPALLSSLLALFTLPRHAFCFSLLTALICFLALAIVVDPYRHDLVFFNILHFPQSALQVGCIWTILEELNLRCTKRGLGRVPHDHWLGASWSRSHIAEVGVQLCARDVFSVTVMDDTVGA